MKKKRKKLSDTCIHCPEPIWQYDDNGKGYCETHARWKHVDLRRVRHPLDAFRDTTSVPAHRVSRAEKLIVDIIRHIGYAEAFWVAEHLAFESGVQWWDERVIIRLSDLQLVAFAAAMRAHREAIYPNRSKRSGKKKKERP